ncbi:uncharacterized protein PpBr36_09884 [Pyricularia pennisetigena]|uniref:uncharacterized protein n=1 Tax=Pyricularia pennisetigena TaxID=1578925 RepID=UPI001150A444|nr:uncharacterized protein PpBr36_09884 [Pyricularia pennisetigena]TLS22328.1 hypothetical protein PpBr36_09884 [Pyricularia pennisetigena]
MVSSHPFVAAGRTLAGASKRLARKPTRAAFSTSRSAAAKNQIYSPIRSPSTFHTHLLLSSSARMPLITLWTTSWCPSCKHVEPLLKSVVESGVGEDQGGVGFALVELDAPDMQPSDLGLTYMINSVPTLLSFDSGEAQMATKVVDGRKLVNRQFLEEWVRSEASRQGSGGGGGGGIGGSGLFGGLFGSQK